MDKNSETRVCKYCGSLYTPQKRGIHNWKNLFKFDWSDLFYLFLFLLILFSVQMYKADIKECRNYIFQVESGNLSQQLNLAYKQAYEEQMEKQLKVNIDFLKNITLGN